MACDGHNGCVAAQQQKCKECIDGDDGVSVLDMPK